MLFCFVLILLNIDVDRLPLVTSAIIQVAQDVEEVFTYNLCMYLKSSNTWCTMMCLALASRNIRT